MVFFFFYIMVLTHLLQSSFCVVQSAVGNSMFSPAPCKFYSVNWFGLLHCNPADCSHKGEPFLRDVSKYGAEKQVLLQQKVVRLSWSCQDLNLCFWEVWCSNHMLISCCRFGNSVQGSLMIPRLFANNTLVHFALAFSSWFQKSQLRAVHACCINCWMLCVAFMGCAQYWKNTAFLFLYMKTMCFL